MDFSNLADKIIERKGTGPSSSYSPEPFHLETAPDRILRLHPSIYRFRDNLYHEHSILKRGDVDTLCALIDLPDTRMTKAEAIWVYNRLFDIANKMDERYIVVSQNLVWDREESKLIPVESFNNMVTTSDATTHRIRSDYE